MTSESDESDESPLDPALVATLATLHEAATDPSGKTWSLPKIAKRAQLPMSSLRRVLTQLDAAGLSATTLNDDGTGSATLTDEGRTMCAQLFGANDGR
ncbi:transcriptional regulator [Burkholderia sp. Nafp2/4-1b]|uniref:transcriptional regulator n=1 Tax=Burkholderia sp. Nafp2/4-1b TaxID=2116686 RepID=UPI000EF881DB|nr:transcriptional regulator [Burkholderia sp. Nafp2/4-1b]RKU05415.1 transcriptional regulator [Burkholderia sp. Nafp2/4-1b]